jgi:hypothetical protein
MREERSEECGFERRGSGTMDKKCRLPLKVGGKNQNLESSSFCSPQKGIQF